MNDKSTEDKITIQLGSEPPFTLLQVDGYTTPDGVVLHTASFEEIYKTLRGLLKDNN